VDDSDIARVAELNPDIVKFDAQWMSRLLESSPGHALLTTMVATFRDRGILTIFEGIEEPWQIDLAAQTGVTMLQGYALGRPELAVARCAEAKAANALRPAQAEAPEPDIVPVRSATRPDRIFGKRAVALG
jgi:EAL domain-containing protein (putative c-di-GMP-specific phosphodiesterase class I)